MKTAIYVPDHIYEEVEKYATEHHYSRSEVFVLAVRELLKKSESFRLLAALDNAYATDESVEDKKVRMKAGKHYAKKVLKETY